MFCFVNFFAKRSPPITNELMINDVVNTIEVHVNNILLFMCVSYLDDKLYIYFIELECISKKTTITLFNIDTLYRTFIVFLI